MKVAFKDKRLDRLETDADYISPHQPQIVRAFRKKMQAIRAAENETDFYRMKSFQFEKMKGARKDQCSMRLNDQVRLILEIIKDKEAGQSVVWIIAIEDYH